MMLIYVLAIWFATGNGAIVEIPLPDTIKKCFDLAKSREETQTVGEVIYSRCVQRILWNQKHSKDEQHLEEDARRWIEGLVDMNGLSDVLNSENDKEIVVKVNGSDVKLNHMHPQRLKRQTLRRQPRIRKEYRMLSDQERMLFHRAVNMLKADTSVSPNKYDALGRLHFLSVDRAHFGPNFLGWHRLFLLVVENALREKIPSVTIPYWDTTLDDKLLDPRSSVIWTPDFLGTANGFVNEGPFAGWMTPTGPLIRTFGTGGTMLNWTFIQNVLRQDHLENITIPRARPDNNLEEHHNQVHIWVGGHMAPPAMAAFDPVFYLLHSFVDLLWEIFRGLQKRKGIDPTTDYPMGDTDIPQGQRYEDPSGIGSLLNRQALSNVFTNNLYKYNRPPSCTRSNPTCGSRHIRCDTSGVQARCISASIFDIRRMFTPEGIPMDGSSGIREVRSARNNRDKQNAKFERLIQRSSEISCLDVNVNEKYVNNFVIDGKSDESKWGYIPVEIIYKNALSTRLQETFRVYEHCRMDERNKTAIRTFVESNGISYNGHFKAIMHFKQADVTSSEIGFIGVRKPNTVADTEVIISAYDGCGRVCQPYCFDLKHSISRKCPGSIKITNDNPPSYGNDVISVSREIWKDNEMGLPQLSREKLAITLVCDVNHSFWPWQNNI